MNLRERNAEQYLLRQKLHKAQKEAKFCIDRIQFLNRQYKEQFEPDLFELLFESTN